MTPSKGVRKNKPVSTDVKQRIYLTYLTFTLHLKTISINILYTICKVVRCFYNKLFHILDFVKNRGICVKFTLQPYITLKTLTECLKKCKVNSLSFYLTISQYINEV